MAVKMGWQGLLYYGAAGSTAATLLENVRDVKIDLGTETGDTTVRGDSSVPPIETGDVVKRMCGIEWNMINDDTDSALAAMLTAAAAGTGVALRGKDYSSGKGPDADFTLSVTRGEPIGGEQTYDFVAKPSRSYGRTPQNYV